MAYGKENYQASSYILKKVELFSDALIEGASIRLERIVSDIDIFEYVERPYLTANLVLVDNAGVFDQINLENETEIIAKKIIENY